MTPSSNNRHKCTNQQNVPSSDEETAIQAQLGDLHAEEFLLKKYAGMVKRIAKPYFMQGAEKEDIIQEGNIGLFEAIHSFSLEKQCTFRSFACMCVTRQIITAIKSYSGQKHAPLNTSISFQNIQNADAESEKYYEPKDCSLPALDEHLISQEWLQNMQNFIDMSLSPYEKIVFKLFVDGKSYESISKELSKPIKSIDGTLQRVRKKLKKYFNEED